jgi:hypothetical protein
MTPSVLKCVKVARVFCVPVRFVMGEDMYNNWKRRCARLRRARIGAGAQRQAAINSALKRLSTGSMQ